MKYVEDAYARAVAQSISANDQHLIVAAGRPANNVNRLTGFVICALRHANLVCDHILPRRTQFRAFFATSTGIISA